MEGLQNLRMLAKNMTWFLSCKEAGEKTSLKARLAEKKQIVSSQGKDYEAQENVKNSQRDM